MNARHLAAIACFFSATTAFSQLQSPAPRPNILLLYVDDMGWGSIGPNGQNARREAGKAAVKTPHIDRLAQEGINFQRAYGCTVCSPARSSLQTGFHQGHTYADRNSTNNERKAIRANDVTMGEVLQSAGYVTGYWGKWGYGADVQQDNPQLLNRQTLPNHQGYSYVLAELHHKRAHTFFQPTLWHFAPGQEEIALIKNTMAPYTDAKKYPQYPAHQNDAKYPLRGYCDDLYAMHCLEFIRKQSIEYNQSKTPFFALFSPQIPHSPFGEVRRLPHFDEAYTGDKNYSKLGQETQNWAAMVARIDAHIGNFLAALDDPNGDGDPSDSVADNTLVLFTSDNGGDNNRARPELGATGTLRGKKGDIWEGGIRVPLVMRWPKMIHGNSTLPVGSNSQRIVDVTDFMPTFAELAGVDAPAGIDGVSIAPTLTGNGHQRPRDFIAHEAQPNRSIIRGNIKLVDLNKKLKLFDLDRDETTDLSRERPQLTRELADLLIGENVRAPQWTANTYHAWTGPSGAPISDADYWSDDVYSNTINHTVYNEDRGSPRIPWTASMRNTGAAKNRARVDRDTRFLSLELGGQSDAAKQKIEVGSHTLTARNELRMNPFSAIELDGGTLETLRWIDLRKNATVAGHGTIRGTVYQAGALDVRSGANRQLTIEGNYRLEHSASVTLAIAGEQPVPIRVSGDAVLNGHLTVQLDPTAQLAKEVPLLSARKVTGTFANANDSVVANDGTRFHIVYSETAVSLVAENGGEVPPKKPNIIHILVDDWSWTDTSVPAVSAGHISDFYQTPHVQRLSDEGVTFPWAYVQQNCAPSRAAFMTGQYAARRGNGVYNVEQGGNALARQGNTKTYLKPANQGPTDFINGDEQTITLAEALHAAGYVTAHIGKYHVGSGQRENSTHPLNQGLDYNFGGNHFGNPGSFFAKGSPRKFHKNVGSELDPYAADYTQEYIDDKLKPFANDNNPDVLVGTAKHLTDASVDAFEVFMTRHRQGDKKEAPVYIQFHFYATHSPVQPRQDLLEKYKKLKATVRPVHDQSAEFAALTEGMDQALGRMIAYLRDPNGDGEQDDSIASNTLVVFTSDNGGTGTTSNYPLRGKKGTYFEGGIHVPLIIWMPGTVATGKVSDSLVHITDMYPTFLDFAGVDYPDPKTHPLDGESLFEHLKDPDHTARHRAPIFYHFPGYMDSRISAASWVIGELDGKRYKYIYSYDPYYKPTAKYDQYQLYNLTDDPFEATNLVDYIDRENHPDPDDPSDPHEYWNYLLNKDVANTFATKLHAWLNQADPSHTWNPLFATYKSEFPAGPTRDGAPDGAPTPAAPASLPQLNVPADQVFRVLDSHLRTPTNDLEVRFSSSDGFHYAIQASSNLIDWVTIDAKIQGQEKMTTARIPSSAIPSGDHGFFRAILVR